MPPQGPPEIVIYRQELWRELKRALRIQQDESPSSLRDAVLTARDRTRRYGRDIEHRSVSRTLLVKGLEYAHTILLDADVLDITNLYVAMTRGSTTLTILSNRSRLTPRRPADHQYTEHDPDCCPRDPAAADRERVVMTGSAEQPCGPSGASGVIDHDADWRVRVDQHKDDQVAQHRPSRSGDQQAQAKKPCARSLLQIRYPRAR